jgi:transposase-like protein
MSNRRNFTPEQKLAILRAHLLEGAPVSDLCDQHKIQPTQYYTWQKSFFENGAVALARKGNAGNERRAAKG